MRALFFEIILTFLFMLFKSYIVEESNKTVNKLCTAIAFLSLFFSLLLIFLHWTHFAPVKILVISQMFYMTFVKEEYYDKLYYLGFWICFLTFIFSVITC